MPTVSNENVPLQLVVAPRSKVDLKYRSFKMKLSDEFKNADLYRFKFALKKTIAGGKMESLDTALEVFTLLEERNLVGPGNLGTLQDLLNTIDRPNLLSMVDDFDDSSSAYPLRPKSDNYLEKDGYRVAIDRGRHFETTEGEFVEVRSGANYALTLINSNSHRCVCNIKIDGYEMFPNGFLLKPKEKVTITRPSREKKKFKFFAITDAPDGSGINKWRKDLNGIIQVVFTPEKDNMKITCVAQGAGTKVLSCTDETSDIDFHDMVCTSFGATNATINIKWKPLGKRGVKLLEYGFQDGCQVDIIFGGRGGAAPQSLPSTQNMALSKENVKFRAGATTLEDDSEQEFVNVDRFPLDSTLAVSLNLRLVAREDVKPIPSTGKCTPLARATLIPPPVPN